MAEIKRLLCALRFLLQDKNFVRHARSVCCYRRLIFAD
jgi:hypothetical protein